MEFAINPDKPISKVIANVNSTSNVIYPVIDSMLAEALIRPNREGKRQVSYILTEAGFNKLFSKYEMCIKSIVMDASKLLDLHARGGLR